MQPIDKAFVKANLPKRDIRGNKGSFGRLDMIVGSPEYIGAPQLALEAALRFGAGYVTVLSEAGVCERLSRIFPEAIYKTMTDFTTYVAASDRAILIGPGLGASRELCSLTASVIAEEGGPVVIDADAINSLALYLPSVKDMLKGAKRKIVLTPHPLEFSRLTGIPVSDISKDREGIAAAFAKESGTTLILKGYRTVVTDGERLLINTSGSSALAKAGSGDVLAGAIASLLATRLGDPLLLSAIAVFVHGMASDRLKDEFSDYGVTPSDLPKEMARVLRLCTE